MSSVDDALVASSMLYHPGVEVDSSTSESHVESAGEGSDSVSGGGGGRWGCVGDCVGDSVVGVGLGIALVGNDVGGSVMKFVSEKFSPRHVAWPVHWKFSEQHLSLAWYRSLSVTYARRRLGSSPHISEE